MRRGGGKKGGVLTSPGKQMFLYITERPPHDCPVSLKLGGKLTTSHSVYYSRSSLICGNTSAIGERTLCARACVCVCERASRGNANNGPANCEAPTKSGIGCERLCNIALVEKKK